MSRIINNRINDKLEKSNLITEHSLNREHVPLSMKSANIQLVCLIIVACERRRISGRRFIPPEKKRSCVSSCELALGF